MKKDSVLLLFTASFKIPAERANKKQTCSKIAGILLQYASDAYSRELPGNA